MYQNMLIINHCFYIAFTQLWRDWREKELEHDKAFAHPRWPEEIAYLEQEDGDLDKLRPQYFNDFWSAAFLRCDLHL